jgi:hypothetical protein
MTLRRDVHPLKTEHYIEAVVSDFPAPRPEYLRFYWMLDG